MTLLDEIQTGPLAEELAQHVAISPDATSTYRITDDLHYAFTDGSAKVLFVTDELTNQVITSGNTINFPQLEYASGQPV